MNLFEFLNQKNFSNSGKMPPITGKNFLPAQISGAALWLDAALIAGKSAGDSVGQWDNLIQPIHVSQSLENAKPTYQTVGGRVVVRFNGDDWLTAGDNFDIGAGSLTAFVVAKTYVSRTTAGGTFLAKADFLSNGRYGFFHSAGLEGGLFQDGFGNTYNNTGDGVIYDDDFVLHELHINRTDFIMDYYRNGSLINSRAINTPPDSTNLNNNVQFNIGAYYLNNFDNYFVGDMKEIFLVLGDPVSEQMLTDLRDYFYEKHNL